MLRLNLLSLTVGNSSDIIASCLFDSMGWCFASNLIESSNRVDGMQRF